MCIFAMFDKNHNNKYVVVVIFTISSYVTYSNIYYPDETVMK